MTLFESGMCSSADGVASGIDAAEFVVRTASDADGIERVAAFNGLIHGDGVAKLTQALFLHHPRVEPSDLFFVVHVPSQKIVSSLCLIPWTWCFDGVEIAAGEMGIVGTLEPYRRRGLVRAQARRFKRRMVERHCLVSHVQGIPYFYRQFGYEYALPLEGGLRLELRDIPEANGQGYAFRRAVLGDLQVLRKLYDEAASDLELHALRDEASWQYLLVNAQGTETECERWLVEEPAGDTVGYFAMPRYHFGDELVVSETSRLRYDEALAVLRQIRILARERGRPGIRLNLPPDCTLMALGRSLGARDLGVYAWQVHIPDCAQMLRALTPVFERRLARSPLVGLTRGIHLGLYEETLHMHFESGRLRAVTSLSFAGGEAIRIPPAQFAQLALGYSSREELQARHPDVGVAPAELMVVDVLFPRLKAFLYPAY